MSKPYTIRKLYNGNIIILKDLKEFKTLIGPINYKIENKILYLFKDMNKGYISLPINLISNIEYVNVNNIIISKEIKQISHFKKYFKIIFDDNNINTKKSLNDNISTYDIKSKISPIPLLEVNNDNVQFNLNEKEEVLSTDYLLIKNKITNNIHYSSINSIASAIKNCNFTIVHTINDRNNIEFDNEDDLISKIGMIVYVRENNNYYKLSFDTNIDKFGWILFNDVIWIDISPDTHEKCNMYWDLGSTPDVDESTEGDNIANVIWDSGSTPDVDESEEGDNCQTWV
ncbi:MAG: hypothetical protein RSE41_05480 [Clostridia bacterium]